MNYYLTDNQVTTYKNDGYLFPLEAFQASEIGHYQQQLSDLWAAMPPNQNAVRGPHINLPWAYELATHPRVLDVVESILGPDLLIWGSMILSKQPDGVSFISWHQDGHYATFLNGSPALTCWIALTESNAQNGCMRVLPKSQTHHFHHEEINNEQNILKQGQTVQGVSEELAVDLELKPGQMSLHHVNILHSSKPNITSSPRIGFIVRFSTPSVRPSENQEIVHARGRQYFEHLNLKTTIPYWSVKEGIQRQVAFDKEKLIQEKRRRSSIKV